MNLVFSLLFLSLVPLVSVAQTNPTPQALPYSQNFNALPASSTTYPSGIQGWNLGNTTTSFIASAPIADRIMYANCSAITTTINLHNYSGKIGIINSDIANLALATAVNSTGKQNIQVDYRIMVIRNPYDGTANTKINESTLQYRIGLSGNFTSVSGLEYRNGTVNQIDNTLFEQNPQIMSVTLPTSCNDQPIIQIRWVSRDVSGRGGRPSFAIDDITITGDPITLPVEFTGMSVTPGPNHNAYITWTTQSETGVNGFYVLRGCSEDLSQTELISPLIPAANSSTSQTYFFADTDMHDAGLYYYWLQSLDYNGETSYYGPQTLVWSPGGPYNPSAPLKTGLNTLYPNPFNPSLTIGYAIEEATPAQIRIYNLRGQAVHSIDLGRQVAGEHNFIWDGKSDRGEACASGVYRVVLYAGKVIDNRKVLLLK